MEPACTGHYWASEYDDGPGHLTHDEFTFCPVHDAPRTVVKDIPMSNDAELNLLVFMDGWTRGSAAKTPHREDAVYMRGYSKGAQDRLTAAEVERSKLGLPPAGPATMQMNAAELPAELTHAIDEAKKVKGHANGTPAPSEIWSALHTGVLHREREEADEATRAVLAALPAHADYGLVEAGVLVEAGATEEGDMDSMLNQFNVIRNAHATLPRNTMPSKPRNTMPGKETAK